MTTRTNDSSSTSVTCTTEGPLARVMLARPDALNALSPTTLRELRDVMVSLRERPEIQVVVIAGEGRAFSVGFDLMAMASAMSQGSEGFEREIREGALLGEQVLSAIADVPAITIASVHGYAVGGAFLIATACDFRVVARDTVFSIPEVDIGLPLIWGGVPLLVRELGPSRARDLVMTGRRFGPSEFEGSGFISRVTSADKLPMETTSLVDELLAKPGPALAQIKAQFQQAMGLESGGRDTDVDRAVDAVMHPDFMTTAMTYVQRLRSKK